VVLGWLALLGEQQKPAAHADDRDEADHARDRCGPMFGPDAHRSSV
jgi:hypothetical protein